MPRLKINGVDIYFEDVGAGQPILLLNELATDLRGWDCQVRQFARSHRLIAFNYRGYPPSGTPSNSSAYAHETLVEDAKLLLDKLGIQSVYLIGHGTGGNIALGLALTQPERVKGLVLAGSGAGAGDPDWKAKSAAFSKEIRQNGISALVESVTSAPQRMPFADKDPLGWKRFVEGMEGLASDGPANLVASAIAMRPSFYDLRDEIARFDRPLLVVVGDRDRPALAPSQMVAETAPYAGLAVLPYCGHTLILEEPELFNRLLSDFLARVEQGRWAGWSAR